MASETVEKTHHVKQSCLQKLSSRYFTQHNELKSERQSKKGIPLDTPFNTLEDFELDQRREVRLIPMGE